MNITTYDPDQLRALVKPTKVQLDEIGIRTLQSRVPGFWSAGRGWVEGGGEPHDGECPRHNGDGICVARSAVGAASAGSSLASGVVIVGWRNDDILGQIHNKVRLARAYVLGVVTLADSIAVLRANLRGANLSGANLRGADLSGANLSGADLRGANLRGADLSGANLSGADLRGADLSGADLSGTNLFRADLRGADLLRANLRGADLLRANLSGANLRGADLFRVNLFRANLRGADLSGAVNKDLAYGLTVA